MTHGCILIISVPLLGPGAQTASLHAAEDKGHQGDFCDNTHLRVFRKVHLCRHRVVQTPDPVQGTQARDLSVSWMTLWIKQLPAQGEEGPWLGNNTVEDQGLNGDDTRSERVDERPLLA